MENPRFRIKAEIPVLEFIAFHGSNKVTAQKAIFNAKDIFAEKYKDKNFLIEVDPEDNTYIYVSEVSEAESTLTEEDLEKLVNNFVLNGETRYGIDAKTILDGVKFDSAFDYINSKYYLVSSDTKNTMELFSELVGEDTTGIEDDDIFGFSLDDDDDDISVEDEDTDDEEPSNYHRRDNSLYAEAMNDGFYEKYVTEKSASDIEKNIEYNKKQLTEERVKIESDVAELTFTIDRDTTLLNNLSQKLDTIKDRLVYMEEDKPKNGYYVSMIQIGDKNNLDAETEELLLNKLSPFKDKLNLGAIVQLLKSDTYALFIGEDKMGSNDNEFNLLGANNLPEEIKEVLKENVSNIIEMVDEDDTKYLKFVYDYDYHKLYDRLIKLGFMKSPHFNSFCRGTISIDIDENGEAVVL